MSQTQTVTNVKNLKINQLTEEQYKEALAAGLINEDELYFTPATEITSAKVGQMLVVKAVDENGNPTEWEVVDGYTKADIDTKLTSYIDDVAALVGGDA